jgi:hypothetical protein
MDTQVNSREVAPIGMGIAGIKPGPQLRYPTLPKSAYTHLMSESGQHTPSPGCLGFIAMPVLWLARLVHGLRRTSNNSG